jgi:threonine/homoserine/homoserine lactone efflux protein
MNNFFESLFGSNWRTTLWGSLMAAAIAIYQAPQLADFLPEDIAKWVKGISGILVVASGIKFAYESKDNKSTK